MTRTLRALLLLLPILFSFALGCGGGGNKAELPLVTPDPPAKEGPKSTGVAQ